MVHGARRESLGGSGTSWNLDGMKSGGSSFFGSISNRPVTKTKAPWQARSCGAESPVRDARDATGRTQSHFRRHTSGRRSNVMPRLSRACITVPLGPLTYGSHWRGYSRWAPLLLHLRAPGRKFPHGRILYEHARTTNAPRQAPINRSVSVSNAPMRPVGVTCAQPAVGSSRSREPTGNLLEIARSRRVRLCL